MRDLLSEVGNQWDTLKWFLTAAWAPVVAILVTYAKVGNRGVYIWLSEAESDSRDGARKAIIAGLGKMGVNGTEESGCDLFVNGIDRWRISQVRVQSYMLRVDLMVKASVFGLGTTASCVVLRLVEPRFLPDGRHEWSGCAAAASLFIWIVVVLLVWPLIGVVRDRGMPKG